MKRATLEKIIRFLVHHLTHTEFVGVENIPEEGPVIIATNHLSQIDTPLLMINPGRPDITALVTDKYKQFAFMRWFINTAEGIWIDRDRADFAAFREAIEALKKGMVVGIAPEGTRSREFQLQQGKPGTILLALKTDAPIVPVAISGTETGFEKIFRLQKPTFVVRFGKPFHLPPIGRDNREEAMQQMTDDIMARIAIMLPESYRGYYADHPRLKDLEKHPDEVLPATASRALY
ncbi:MAG TPA: lysophospholipid acyltransferase family protein [Anaerolineaceae bacterium]